MKKAVVLHSGGLDSSTVIAIARAENFDVYPIFFAYGQRHKVEAEHAQRVLDYYKLTMQVLPVNLALWGGSALTDPALAIPKDELGQHGIPLSYVPARNLVFLSLAASYAESIGAHDLFIGVNDVDYSGYPDCRDTFIRAFENCVNLATRAADNPDEHYTVHAPLQWMGKAEIIRKAVELKVPLELTHSCYAPDQNGRPCGHCDACLLRAAGFEQAGLPDPALLMK